MRRRDFVRTAGLAAGLVAARQLPAFAFLAEKPKVLFFTRSAGFEHSSIRREGDQLSHAEKVFTELGQQHDFEVTATKDGRVFDEDLAKYSAIFFYTTGDLTQPKDGEAPPMSADGKKRLLDFVAHGKGFLASHCGSDTFHSAGEAYERQQQVDDYIAMLGGEFISHGPQQKSIQVVISKEFPGTQGLSGRFEMTEEWYSLKNFSDDLHVILAQDTTGMEGNDYQRPAYPSTWARKHHEGRVFYTSMGHREDVWSNPVFQQVLLGGLSFALGQTSPALEANLTEATPGAHVMPPRRQ